MARLDDDQAELLIVLCEATRRQPRGGKQSFMAVRTMAGPSIQHPQLAAGDHTTFHWADLEALHRHSLLQGRAGRSELVFDVSPEGFEHFDRLIAAKGGPTARVEESVRRLLDSADFRTSFGPAFERWSGAEALYWSDRSGDHATQIGHLCREAMQAFGMAFAGACGLPAASADRTVDNVRSGLSALSGRVSTTRLELLDALLVYWGAVIDVVQRQEHGSTKKGGALTTEDSRVAVFQTALVMFELARVL
jgi:hypothetical protein